MKVINAQTLGDMCEHLLDGEPVFIIRAQDIAAIEGVTGYVLATKKHGGRNVYRSEAQLSRIRNWQLDNPNKVKIAD